MKKKRVGVNRQRSLNCPLSQPAEVEHHSVALVIVLSVSDHAEHVSVQVVSTSCRSAVMAQSAAQLVSLPAGTELPAARYVDWLQVQGFLDMAESALRAKNAANDVCLQM